MNKLLFLLIILLALNINYSYSQGSKDSILKARQCELDSIEKKQIFHSYGEDDIIGFNQSKLNKVFLKNVLWSKDYDKLPPTKVYFSFVLTSEQKILNTCSSHEIKNHDILIKKILNWFISNEIKVKNSTRFTVFFSCIKYN
ncbi:hypothetical protein KMW28_21640 [Flammeovirga yaeyamensis]|uniref:Uncharacterized protein n=1 Tax=Flammeovirga yaeyamensis TaxID=367791 RepID=A0AAX1NBY8_9BACT|nr:hypothetical protein [Flammeovirga yaeyamensis]MBB3697043.1 hypothetical protein [Flammeovirga yaeyamensis]NMF33705.1 hypothetical protein [Flammeovirga yaeyamensis]QWG05029.1 hypothetical protein KMW28_21640 [Flammeovirga yaeyamensis]